MNLDSVPVWPRGFVGWFIQRSSADGRKKKKKKLIHMQLEKFVWQLDRTSANNKWKRIKKNWRCNSKKAPVSNSQHFHSLKYDCTLTVLCALLRKLESKSVCWVCSEGCKKKKNYPKLTGSSRVFICMCTFILSGWYLFITPFGNACDSPDDRLLPALCIAVCVCALITLQRC